MVTSRSACLRSCWETTPKRRRSSTAMLWRAVPRPIRRCRRFLRDEGKLPLISWLPIKEKRGWGWRTRTRCEASAPELTLVLACRGFPASSFRLGMAVRPHDPGSLACLLEVKGDMQNAKKMQQLRQERNGQSSIGTAWFRPLEGGGVFTPGFLVSTFPAVLPQSLLRYMAYKGLQLRPDFTATASVVMLQT